MFEFKPNPKPEPREKKKRKRIPPISEKKKHELKVYKKIRDQFLNENTICEKCLEKHSDQVHHQKGRQGHLLIDTSYFMAVCAPCHRHIEENPLESLKMGWSFKRLDK